MARGSSRAHWRFAVSGGKALCVGKAGILEDAAPVEGVESGVLEKLDTWLSVTESRLDLVV